MKASTLLMGLAFALLAAGCERYVPPPKVEGGMYEVGALHHEAVSGKVDARWFVRDVHDSDGTLVAKELVYCPIVPASPTVCRTGVVWERDKSRLEAGR